MLTPAEVASLILGYCSDDPERAAALVMDGLNAAGYAVVNKDVYVELAKRCAVADGIAATIAGAAR